MSHRQLIIRSASIGTYFVLSFAVLYGLQRAGDYFTEAMERLRDKLLNVALDAVSHPASSAHKTLRNSSRPLPVQRPQPEGKTYVETYFERGFSAMDPDEKIRLIPRRFVQAGLEGSGGRL